MSADWRSTLARFVTLVSAAAVLASMVLAAVMWLIFLAFSDSKGFEDLGWILLCSALALLTVLVAAIIGLARAMRRLEIRPVAPLIGLTAALLPPLAIIPGSLLAPLGLLAVPLAAAGAFTLVHPPGRPQVWRLAVCNVLVLALALVVSVGRPLEAERLREFREREYAELGFPLFAAPPPEGFLLDSIDALPTTLKISYRDIPIRARTMSRPGGGMMLIDHTTRTRLIELTERKADSAFDPPAKCGFRTSAFSDRSVQGAPCAEVARHPTGAPIYTWSVDGEQMYGTVLSGVLVIGTQPNREDVADEVVIEVLRSLTPATPAELARREP